MYNQVDTAHRRSKGRRSADRRSYRERSPLIALLLMSMIGVGVFLVMTGVKIPANVGRNPDKLVRTS
jgi:hypothetical protein